MPYDPSEWGIGLPVELSSNGRSVRLIAKLDTGAENCIFQRIYGEQLGFQIETGELKRFSTQTGSLVAWGHTVLIKVAEFEFESVVYFSDLPRNVLGRAGWIQRFRLGLVDYDCKLFLAVYDS